MRRVCIHECVCVLGGGGVFHEKCNKKMASYIQWTVMLLCCGGVRYVSCCFAAWFDVDTEKSTHVYVSGLPSDLTDEEFNELMAKCGLIMFDPHTHKPKVKLYRNADGSLKGDGRCCYIKVMMWTLISLFISHQRNVNVALKGIVIPVFLLRGGGGFKLLFLFLIYLFLLRDQFCLFFRDQFLFFSFSQRSVSF